MAKTKKSQTLSEAQWQELATERVKVQVSPDNGSVIMKSSDHVVAGKTAIQAFRRLRKKQGRG